MLQMNPKVKRDGKLEANEAKLELNGFFFLVLRQVFIPCKIM